MLDEPRRSSSGRKPTKKPKTPRRQKASPKKGIFTEYLDAQFNFADLAKERKKQLARIAKLRNRDILVYAADARSHRPPQVDARIVYDDLLAINDQLSVLTSKSVDVILETTGGFAEVAEDIVNLLRAKFNRVGFIVPGQAKSAGTIMVMSGDDILMEQVSSLGPIDAQITWQGKVFSAHAMLEGFDKIKREVDETGKLNRAYIPMLQGISPGDIEACTNAQQFSKSLVSKWLERYKFSRWKTHSQTGEPVTQEQRRQIADEVARKLSDHGRWLTHGRSLKIDHLREMGLRIIDYSKRKELCDAIRRYHILLQMTFGGSVYKLFETPTSQIMRHVVTQQKPAGPKSGGSMYELGIECQQCKSRHRLQANLGAKRPIKPGFIAFPKNNRFKCPGCGFEHQLDEVRRDIEGQTKLPIV